jgi:hypothetical protein
VDMNGSTLNAGGGNITITGNGGLTASDNYGVYVGGSVQTSGNGAIAIRGSGGASTGNMDVGVWIASSINHTGANAGSITIVGQGGNGGGDSDFGIFNTGGIITVNAPVQLQGTGGSGGNNGHGIVVRQSISSSGTSPIRLIGAGSGVGGIGVFIDGSAGAPTIGGAGASGDILLHSLIGGTTANGFITTSGQVTFNSAAAGGVTQGTASTITAGNLHVVGTGTFSLARPGNNVSIVAANVTGDFSFANNGNFAVGQVTSNTGVNEQRHQHGHWQRPDAVLEWRGDADDE